MRELELVVGQVLMHPNFDYALPGQVYHVLSGDESTQLLSHLLVGE